jgi:hypothetical protein
MFLQWNHTYGNSKLHSMRKQQRQGDVKCKQNTLIHDRKT